MPTDFSTLRWVLGAIGLLLVLLLFIFSRADKKTYARRYAGGRLGEGKEPYLSRDTLNLDLSEHEIKELTNQMSANGVADHIFEDVDAFYQEVSERVEPVDEVRPVPMAVAPAARVSSDDETPVDPNVILPIPLWLKSNSPQIAAEGVASESPRTPKINTVALFKVESHVVAQTVSPVVSSNDWNMGIRAKSGAASADEGRGALPAEHERNVESHSEIRSATATITSVSDNKPRATGFAASNVIAFSSPNVVPTTSILGSSTANKAPESVSVKTDVSQESAPATRSLSATTTPKEIAPAARRHRVSKDSTLTISLYLIAPKGRAIKAGDAMQGIKEAGLELMDDGQFYLVQEVGFTKESIFRVTPLETESRFGVSLPADQEIKGLHFELIKTQNLLGRLHTFDSMLRVAKTLEHKLGAALFDIGYCRITDLMISYLRRHLQELDLKERH